MEGMNNITDVIRAKERELQKIQDMRFSQLERTIEERDQLLLESSRRFEQLKDDFQYNLRLLEARDKEITRLESIIEKQGRDREEVDQQVRNLLSRIESMQQKEKERTEKFEQEKALSKRILSETKAVIESMQWSAEEDIRMKNNEISNLKKDIQLLNRAKDEAVEIQRRDLTVAFEQIIQQREEQITQREGELVHQMSLLDQRFERLSTENMTLKAAMREVKAQHERDVEEISRLEEGNRQLHYQIEDSIRTKEQIEDSLRRQVSNLQNEVSKFQDQRNREKQDLESQVEKFKNEAQRERDFRASVEKRLEDLQANSTHELMTLNEEILVQQRRIHGLEQELDSTKAEKEQTIAKLGNKRVESDSLFTKNRLLTDELDSAAERNRRLEQNYQALESTMLQLQKEFDHYKMLMDRELNLSKDSAKDEIAELKRSCADQVQRMRQNHEEESLKLRSLYEDKLFDKQKEVDEMRILNGERFVNENKEKDAEITQLKIQCQVKEQALQDERTESEALRLRLKALEAQLLSSTQELRLLKNSKSNPLRPTITTSFPSASNGLGTNDLSLPEIPTFEMSSPMMSEDFNMSHIHYPDSPQLPTKSSHMRDAAPMPNFGSGIATQDAENVMARYGFSPFPPHRNAPPPSTNPIPPPLPALNHQLDAVTAENEMLKKVVKEMRQDIEDLRTMQEKQSAITPQKLTSASVPIADNDAAARDTVSNMEGALREKQEEIERLKNERKKLMDTGNELRSALFKVQAKELEDTQETLEKLRDENLGTVYHWIRDGVADHRSTSQSKIRNDYFSHLRDPVHNNEPPYRKDRDDVSSLEDIGYPDVRQKPGAPMEDEISYDASESAAPMDKPATAIRRRNEVPISVIGNAITSRSVPKSSYYPATRHLSSDEERRGFIVHKVPPGGHLEDSSGATKQSNRMNSFPPRSNSHRTTPGQTSALERLKQNQNKQKLSAMKAEEDIRLAKSRVVNYAELKNKELST